ncbi:hypothetical protein TNCT6_78980 [Streptomyces sp. 6-11-2]|nr:hypothetical protein TNCT6_78980 [Streptomyces sp. 6-11-2]
MVTAQGDGWAGMGWDWKDYDDIRRRLDQGADPEAWSGGRPLHRAAVFGSPEVVAELARRVADVDALENGVTALWEAVVSRKPDNARGPPARRAPGQMHGSVDGAPVLQRIVQRRRLGVIPSFCR